MPISIVSNLSSNYAMQAINSRSNSITATTQRLSSGIRVFSASQDPAALSVGLSLKVDNAALSEAQLNVSAGVSTLQIADGALGTLSDVLTRMNSLANEAASGQLSDASRLSINSEFQSLKAEIDRVANVTNFNGTSLLAGTSAFTLQGGSSYAADGVTAVQIDQSKVSANATFRYDYDATTEQLTMTRTDQGTSSRQTVDLTGLLNNLAGTGNQLGAGQTLPIDFSGLGVTLTLGPSFDRTADIEPTVTDNTGANISVATPTFAPTTANQSNDTAAALQALSAGSYNHVTGGLTVPTNSDGTNVTLGAIAGISYSVNGAAATASGAASDALPAGGGTVNVYADDPTGGSSVLLGTLTLGATATTGAGTGSLTVPVGQGVIGASYQNSNAPTTLTYRVGSGVIAGQDKLDVTIPAATANALGIDTLDVTTQQNASASIDALQAALTTLTNARSTVGAQESRLDSINANLNISVENNTSASSALLDDDPSADLTQLASDNAMLQVGVSMLSQANKIPEMLLQLLQH